MPAAPRRAGYIPLTDFANSNHPLSYIQIRLVDSLGRSYGIPGQAQPTSSGKHRPSGGNRGSKRLEAELRVHIIVQGFHSASHEVHLVPKAGAAGVAEVLLPPGTMRLRPSPPLHGFEVLPVPAHAEMQRDHAEDDVPRNAADRRDAPLRPSRSAGRIPAE